MKRWVTGGMPVSRLSARVTDAALGPYQTAVVRIGFALTWLVFLVREYPHRQELYGPDGPWSWALAHRLTTQNGAFTALMWFRGRLWFEVVYALAVLSAALLLLGWRTRTVSVLFMVGVFSLQNRSVFVGDGGDNVVHLMALYLVFTRCGLVPAILWTVWAAQGLWWAAGRRARWAQPRILLDVVANLVHNGALVVIMAETCLIYATAGWYKIQGSRWQDGTAVYYPLHLDYFSPWPGLAGLLSASGTLVMLVTYGTVIAQVAFPFALFNRRVKNVLLVILVIEHVAIAVVLGLPFFSLAMIAADAVFLPTSFLRRIGTWATRARDRLRIRRRDAGAPAEESAGRDGEPDRVGFPA